MEAGTFGKVAATVAALGFAFAAGAVYAGGDSEQRLLAAEPGGRSRVAAPAVAGALEPAASCEELLAWYVSQGVERVGPWGWDSPVMIAAEAGAPDGIVLSGPQGAAEARAPGMEGATASGTGTNVQEAGVDEPDLVKTDGRLLVRVHDGLLTTYDVSGAAVRRLDTVDLPGIADPEILLVGDRVVAVGADERGPYSSPATRVVQVDVSDPADPVLGEPAVYEAGLVTARQHGDAVRLVLSAGLPDLDFVNPGMLRTEDAALERNRQIVRESTLTDWLPRVRFGGSGEPQDLVECTEVQLPGEEAGLGTMVVVGLDPASPQAWEATGVATSTQIAYSSADRLYLATDAWTWGWPGGWAGPGDGRVGVPPHPADGTTALHAFALDGLGTRYLASGEVDGRVADRWSMDAARGVLRVAVGPTAATGNFNSVVTLAESGDDLVEVGRVDKLGVGEEIKSVRWFDSMAVLVTFRQVDPLYVVDLTDSRRPRLLGELKIPGFSEYLHPLDRNRMLGIGQDATRQGVLRGAQAALFDLRDLSEPRRVDQVQYAKGTQALAGLDPRQFTWLPDRRTALTVVAQGWEGRTGWVSVLTVGAGELSNRMVEVEYGAEVDLVRLLPLPSGKVVLVTGDGVSFFAV